MRGAKQFRADVVQKTAPLLVKYQIAETFFFVMFLARFVSVYAKVWLYISIKQGGQIIPIRINSFYRHS